MPTYQYTVDLEWDGPGSPGVSVWHGRAEGLIGSDFQGVVDAIRDFWGTILAGSDFASGFSAAGRSEAINVANQEIITVTPWLREGTNHGLPYAGPVECCLTLLTSSATRSGRGRKFLGPLTENAMSADGTPTTAVLTKFRDAGTALVADSVGLTQSAVGVYSRTQGLFRDLTNTRVRDYFATLRSRRD